MLYNEMSAFIWFQFCFFVMLAFALTLVADSLFGLIFHYLACAVIVESKNFENIDIGC